MPRAPYLTEQVNTRRNNGLLIGASLVLLFIFSLPLAVLAAPNSLAKIQDLNFGRFAGGGGSSGTMTIAPSGARSVSGPIIPFGNDFSPARFTITGTPGASYVLILPDVSPLKSGPDQMEISAVTASIPSTGVLPAAGMLPFTVGGTLSVSSHQRRSAYSGSLIISVQ